MNIILFSSQFLLYGKTGGLSPFIQFTFNSIMSDLISNFLEIIFFFLIQADGKLSEHLDLMEYCKLATKGIKGSIPFQYYRTNYINFCKTDGKIKCVSEMTFLRKTFGLALMFREKLARGRQKAAAVSQQSPCLESSVIRCKHGYRMKKAAATRDFPTHESRVAIRS